MNNQVTTTKNNIVSLMSDDKTKARLNEILGKNSQTFATSVVQIVNSSEALKKCEPVSILNAALVATTLGLPINNQLGLAYIVPYGTSATLQLGYRAFLQLAQRSGQFKTINVTDVREGEIKKTNRLTGEMDFEWIDTDARESTEIIGYIAFFELLNGYSHTLYMKKAEIDNHAKKYSQTYKKYNSGLWKDEFDAMAKKTVLKMLLSKYAPLSIEMSKAQIADQSIVKDYDGGETIDVDYVDNTQPQKVEISDEEKAIAQFKEVLLTISNLDELKSMEESSDTFTKEEMALITAKRKELTKK